MSAENNVFISKSVDVGTAMTRPGSTTARTVQGQTAREGDAVAPEHEGKKVYEFSQLSGDIDGYSSVKITIKFTPFRVKNYTSELEVVIKPSKVFACRIQYRVSTDFSRESVGILFLS